jgi:hypothetical protein
MRIRMRDFSWKKTTLRILVSCMFFLAKRQSMPLWLVFLSIARISLLKKRINLVVRSFYTLRIMFCAGSGRVFSWKKKRLASGSACSGIGTNYTNYYTDTIPISLLLNAPLLVLILYCFSFRYLYWYGIGIAIRTIRTGTCGSVGEKSLERNNPADPSIMDFKFI